MKLLSTIRNVTRLAQVLALSSLGAATALPLDSAAAPVHGFIRKPGAFPLDSSGSQLVISNAEEGTLAVSATWPRGSCATRSAPRALREGWFVYIDAPGSIWFFDGRSNLSVLVHDDYDNFSGGGGASEGEFQTCPVEVKSALPETVRKTTATSTSGEPRGMYGPEPIGVGILLFRNEGSSPPNIRAVVPGSPAAKAGIQAGWKILSVDGTTCTDTAACWKLIHGKSGTAVTLRVATSESAPPTNVSLVRHYVFPDR